MVLYTVYENFEKQNKERLISMPLPDEKIYGRIPSNIIGYDVDEECFTVIHPWGENFGMYGKCCINF